MTQPLEAATALAAAIDEVERAVVGKRRALNLLVCGVLTRGHVLIEDLPGLAKTLAARAFADVCGLGFSRIQFTPDLLPADVTGGSMWDEARREFEFRPGPVFANMVLADEVNRAPPKTQSALLEAMQEAQVTVDGTTHALPRPFTVLATQNPVEFEGTYPLPEAQLDRFRLRVTMGYPEAADEAEILARRLRRRRDDVELRRVLTATDVTDLQDAVEDVHVDATVRDYVVALARATRERPGVDVGVSPRGTVSLLLVARAWALLAGRDYVVPDDVKALAVPALAHRLVLRPDLWVRGVRPEAVVAEVLDAVPAPAAVTP